MALRIRLYNTNPSESGFTSPGKISTIDGEDALELYRFNQRLILSQFENTMADAQDTNTVKPVIYKTEYDAGVKATATIPVGTANLAAGHYVLRYEMRFIRKHFPETITQGGAAPIIGNTVRNVEFSLGSSMTIANAVVAINRQLASTRQSSSDILPVVTASTTNIVLTMPNEFGYFENTGLFSRTVTNGIPVTSTTPMVTTTYVSNRIPFGDYDYIKNVDILENPENTRAYRLNDGNQPVPGMTYTLYTIRMRIPRTDLIETNQVGYSGAVPDSRPFFKIWIETSLVSAFETAIDAADIGSGGSSVKILISDISNTA